MNKREIDILLRESSKYFGLTVDEITGKDKKREIVYPRFHIIKLVKLVSGLKTWQSIGKLFKRDHSTIMNAIDVHRDLCETETQFLNDWLAFREHYDTHIAEEVKSFKFNFNEEELIEYTLKLQRISEREELLRQEKEQLYSEILNR